jgi:3-oxoacyl-[acyl-carrier-protein] synthase II
MLAEEEEEEERRIVLTGMGIVSPFGSDLKIFWDRLCQGHSAVQGIRSFATSDFRSQIAAEIPDFDPSPYLTKNESHRADRYAQMAQVAAILALQDSGIVLEKTALNRAGVFMGNALGGVGEWEEQYQNYLEKGPRRISPFLISKMMSNAIAGDISMRFGFHGSNYTASSACASSAHALGQALKSIRNGEHDLILAGGSEAAISPLIVGGFCAVKALSKRNDDPQKASRPFDRERDGFVLGEGAGVLLLEELKHAQQRGAKIYAEFLGAGFTADAHHITDPHPEGKYATLAMQNALHDGHVSPEEVQYINAHGTSTQKNDSIETLALKNCFGNHAKNLKINSTKSMLGHWLGAAAAIEAIVTVLSLSHQKIHPTANYEFPDPECDLDYCPLPLCLPLHYALSNSFGFGGHNVSLLFGAYPSSKTH